ncbi:MAG: carboxypeptidase regulatory-like domain-containing protein [Gemmatimonadaceae bacterium]|nr:carboxypeptidase regulatory-like domain-containing protein [Gemmatimonadaceae bacterium]
MTRHVGYSLCVVATVASLAAAQASPPTGAVPGGRISGVVRDSLARGPLSGAWVQFVEAGRYATVARTVITDSLGRFAFDGVPNGRYTIGFFHALLDSLGVEPLLRQVTVSRGRAARIELATPSPARLRSAICSAPLTAATGGVVLGVLRDARTRAPVADATVTGKWIEVSFRKGSIDRARGRVAVTTEANGWFALCSVPARGMMFLQASRGADSTDVVDLPIPASGFVHRQLFVGPSRTIVFGGATPDADSLLPVRRTRVGDGLLNGTIVTTSGGRPVAGALVRLGDNPPTRADDRGAFVLAEAPAGTRMLEVRAVGYNPARVAVDVVAGATPVTVALATSKAVLDTVKVIVARAADRHAGGFEDRRRSGAGMYLTAEQIARRGAFSTSDLFRMLRGMRIGYDYDTLATDANQNALVEMNDQLSDRRILMRGISGNWCEPALWFDGNLIPELSVDALDGWVPTERLAAIEIYSEATVPPQFQRTRSGCGAVLFWTK